MIKLKNVGVIGLGYVGLPRALQLCSKSYKVFAFDKDISKINQLKKGNSYLSNLKSELIKKFVDNKMLIPTSDFSNLKKVNVVILCLPTPLNNKLEPELKYVNDTFKIVKKYLKKKLLICLESTSYPGTTYETIINKIPKKFKVGKDIFVCYSPERNDPGLKRIKLNNIPKIVSGYTDKCRTMGFKLYNSIFKKIIDVESIEIAEMTKIYENIFRAVNIGFVNEMKKICFNFNIDINKVISAAKTKPFGFLPFYPGPGLGGHCIPIDPFYLSWKAKKLNVKTEFIELAGKINRSMPSWIVNQVNNILKYKNLGSIRKKKILISGIAYKKNINDCRESPAFELISILRQKGAEVMYYDPYIKKIPPLRNYDFSKIKAVNLDKKQLEKIDLVILVTDHDNVNYSLLKKYSKIIFDTRNKLEKDNKKIYHL